MSPVPRRVIAGLCPLPERRRMSLVNGFRLPRVSHRTVTWHTPNRHGLRTSVPTLRESAVNAVSMAAASL